MTGVSGGPARRAVTSVRVRAIDGERVLDKPDKLVTEEPMEIRVHGPGQEPRPLAITMRTPGNDFELAVGFCLTEGVLDRSDDLDTVAYCLAGEGEQEYNVVTVTLRRPVALDGPERRFVANASCGLCGKTTLDEVEQHCAAGRGRAGSRRRSILASLPDRLRAAQAVFDATGGLHAVRTVHRPKASSIALREDVGRHNALDKLIGHAALEQRLPLADEVLMVSGRVSFEIVQKAAVAGIPIVCAVSAPSSLAVDAANRFGQTLVGFVRGDRANVYTHFERDRRRQVASACGLEGIGEDQVAQANEARSLGRIQAVRHGRDEAQPLQGDRPHVLGESRQPSLRVADHAQGCVRRLRARSRRLPRLDAVGRAPLHHSPQPAPGQHDGRARPRGPRRRRCAAVS